MASFLFVGFCASNIFFKEHFLLNFINKQKKAGEKKLVKNKMIQKKTQSI